MITFYPDTHQYVVDGVIVPSVSTILGATIFKKKYEGVSEEILNNARQFGTNVHKAIETGIDDDLTETEYMVYQRYLNLIKKHNLSPVEHELIVHYGYEYAGTLDMLALWGEWESLGDVKTTSKLDIEYLSWQLTMYELAYCHLFNAPQFEKLFAIWLSKKNPAKLVEIPRKTKDEVLELVRLYHEQNTSQASF
jgi:hypothetical protein